jgi:PEP-CTERM motif
VVASFDPVDPWVDIIQGGIPNTKTFLSGIGPFILNTAGITDVTMSWMTLLSPTVVPVPEPSTLAVISSGLMLAWIARRRSRNLNRA